MAKELTNDQMVAGIGADYDQEVAHLGKAFAETDEETKLCLICEIDARIEAAEAAEDAVDIWIYRMAHMAFVQVVLRHERKEDPE